jgi:hypothetical protein
VEFSQGAGLDVNSAATNGKGNLVLSGVSFTEAAPMSAPGWDGVTFVVPSGGLSGSSITNSTFEFAGTLGECQKGEVFVDGRGASPIAPGPTITGSEFVDAAECGIFWDHISNGDSYASNDFGGASNPVCHP